MSSIFMLDRQLASLVCYCMPCSEFSLSASSCSTICSQ